MGKRSKDGITVMVTSTAVGTMLPFQMIATGKTNEALTKFVFYPLLQERLTVKLGGDMNPEVRVATSTTGHTLKDANAKAKILAKYPPYYKDTDTKHIICGRKYHALDQCVHT